MEWEELRDHEYEGDAGVERIPEIERRDAGQDANRAQVQQMQIDLDGKPTGWAAAGYTARMADLIDKANEEIRERYYKNNPVGYRNYLDYAKRQQAATLATAADYESANLRHARREDEKFQAEQEANSLMAFNGTFLATHKLNEADAISSAQDVLEAETYQNAAVMDEFVGSGGMAEGDAALGSDIVSTHEAASAASVGKYRDAVKSASSAFTGRIQQLWSHNDKELGAIYERTRERAIAAGASPFTADAIAQKTVNGIANKIMIDMFAGSSVGSGNRQAFEEWMKIIKSRQPVTVGPDGKASYNPMARWCLTRSDVAALDEKYKQVVVYEKRVMKANEKARMLAEKEERKRTAAANVESINSVVEMALGIRNRLLYGDMKDANVFEIESRLNEQISNMFRGQYHKEKAIAIGKIHDALDQVHSLRERVGKLDAKQAAQELLGLYNQVRSDQINRIAMNVKGDYYGQYFFKDKDGNYTGESVETLNRDEGATIGADIQAMTIATRLRDMDIPPQLKAQLDNDIRHLSEERQRKDRDVCAYVLNGLNFQRPKDGQRERVSFKMFETVMIDGVSSGQSGTDVIIDGSGKRINMSASSGDVITIDLNGVQYRFGKAEMEDVVRHVYDIVSDFKEDISGTDDASVKRRDEIVAKMRGYIENMAIGKDSEHGYRAIIDGLRTSASHLKAAGVTGRADYSYRAAFRQEDRARYGRAREASGRIMGNSKDNK